MMMLMMTMKSDDVDAGKISLMTAITTMDGGKSLRMMMVMVVMMVAKILMEDDA